MIIGKNKLKNQINFMVKNNYSFTFTDYVPVLQSKNSKMILNKTNIINSFTFHSFIKIFQLILLQWL